MTELERLVRETHRVKGAYHTQIAMCNLYDYLGLVCYRPGEVPASLEKGIRTLGKWLEIKLTRDEVACFTPCAMNPPTSEKFIIKWNAPRLSPIYKKAMRLRTHFSKDI